MNIENYFERSVIDASGLDGAYDCTLEYKPRMIRYADGRPYSPQEGVPAAPTPPREALPGMSSAVQSQLGLRLDSRKAPYDVVVIDYIERTPTEN
jgi:uncharacterized protein (TIGR03435 family)